MGTFRQFVKKTPLYPALNSLRSNLSRWHIIREWQRQGCPLPPPPEVKHATIRQYGKRFRLDVLVETGTYFGDTIAATKNHFADIYSIELSPELHQGARERFKGDQRVHLLLGDSGSVLKQILATITRPPLFWLDARFAFGDRNGTLPLYSCSQYSGLASLYSRNLKHFGMTLDQSEDVSVLTLDEFCRMERLQRIHFLKLDVEGHELKVLHGAQELLERGGIDFIQFEFGGCNIDSRTYLHDFYELLTPRYHIYRIVTDGLRLVTAYREIGEIFTTTNYMRELVGH